MKEFFVRLAKQPATVKKFIVAFVGAVGTAISLGLLPDSFGKWLAVVVSLLSSLGVYGVRNADDTPNGWDENGL